MGKPDFKSMREFLPKLVGMHEVDQDDGADKGTVAHAISILDMLEYSGARCPLVFWHGGDAVVFEWDQKVLLTITDDAAMPFITPAGRAALSEGEQP